MRGPAVAVPYRPGASKSDCPATKAVAPSNWATVAYFCVGIFLLLFRIAPGFAQMRTERAVETTTAANAVWDKSLPGNGTYRSYRTVADVIVGADPDPAVKALDPIYGQGNSATASSALKALDLVFGEGVMTFDQPSGNNVTGTFDMGGGFVLDLKGT